MRSQHQFLEPGIDVGLSSVWLKNHPRGGIADGEGLPASVSSPQSSATIGGVDGLKWPNTQRRSNWKSEIGDYI